MGRFEIGGYRIALGLIVTLSLLATANLVAQTKVATVDQYAALMKSNAEIGAKMNAAIGSAAYGDARGLFASLRSNFVLLDEFWTARKRDDAVAIVKDALARIEALDRMLQATPVDSAAIGAASAEFGRTCLGCHRLYREGTNQSGFSFKPGVF